jgi:multisubunit Na+/H+ antiporter MnhG subunit
MNWIEFIGDICEILGGILIALAVIAVHDTFNREHKIDEAVSSSIKKEHVYVFTGVTLLIFGFFLQQLGRYIG